MRELIFLSHYSITSACVGLIIATSLVHSILGERRLIGPLLRQREGILQYELARFLIRMVWHFMSLLFWIIAAALVAGLNNPQMTYQTLLAGVALGIGGAGVIDAVGSRGRHIGWPLLVLIGILAGIATLFDF